MSASLYDEILDAQIQGEQEPEPEIPERTFHLLHGGQLTDTFRLGEHEICIRTLKIGEEFEASDVVDQWKETDEAGRALVTALVAAAIVSIDGRPLVQGLGPGDEGTQAKFDYIRKNWYWFTVRLVYEHYEALVQQLLQEY